MCATLLGNKCPLPTTFALISPHFAAAFAGIITLRELKQAVCATIFSLECWDKFSREKKSSKKRAPLRDGRCNFAETAGDNRLSRLRVLSRWHRSDHKSTIEIHVLHLMIGARDTPMMSQLSARSVETMDTSPLFGVLISPALMSRTPCNRHPPAAAAEGCASEKGTARGRRRERAVLSAVVCRVSALFRPVGGGCKRIKGGWFIGVWGGGG